MGLKKYIGLIPLLLFIGVHSSFAQSKHVVLHGKITDTHHKAISYAAVQNMNTGEGINSDARGFYILKTTLPATLNAFSLAYAIQQKQVNEARGDSVEVNFELSEDSAQLQPVTVTANHPAQLVSESPALMDFELKDNRLWMMYSVKGGNKLEVTDTGGKPIAQMTPNYYFHKDSINQTPHGFLYSIYGDSLLLFSLDTNTISFKTMSLSTYKQYTGTLVAFKFPRYYYIHFDSLDCRVNYYCFDKSTNKKNVIYRYMDTKLHRANRETEETLLVLQMFLPLEDAPNGQAGIENRNDTLVNALGYVPDDQEIKQLQKAIYLKEGASISEIENAYNSAQRIINSSGDPFAAESEAMALSGMMGKVFSILRIVNDSAYIFNFDNNMLDVYSPTNTDIRQVPLGISANALKYRKKNVLVDDERQVCYFKYERGKNTYLQKINLVTGKISYTTVLKYPFVSKVRISGGYAYFSYFNTQDKDNIYNGQTCIYKQKLE